MIRPLPALPARMLIDASLYVFRAYHAHSSDRFDREGQLTHAAFGFVGTLLGMLEQIRPSQVAVCFDGALGSSFRHQLDGSYKANRERPDANLLRQFDYCRRFANALGLTALTDQTFEADDLIASLAAQSRTEGLPVLILSADKDLGQLIGSDDRQWDFGKGQPFGPEGVQARLGVLPEQVADWLAMTGDAIDNIRGIDGVGAKTAAHLLQHFGSLDALIARVGEVPFLRQLRGAASLAPKLQRGFAQALHARGLTRLAEHAPVPPWTSLSLRSVDLEHFDALCDEAGFGPMLRGRARRWDRTMRGEPLPSSNEAS